MLARPAGLGRYKWSMRCLIHGIADQNNLRTEEVPFLSTETSKEASARTISKAVSMNIELDRIHHRSSLTAILGCRGIWRAEAKGRCYKPPEGRE